MGISFRIAPGLRIRASSRGLRASVGPRVARVHFGAGRPGVSTGIGPVGFYTSLSGTRRGSGSRSTSRGPTPAQLQRMEAYQSAQEALTALTTIHHQAFAPVTRPQAPLRTVDEQEVRDRHRAAATQGISWFARSRRKAARAAAADAAAAEIAAARAQAAAEHQAAQKELDRRWDALVANDEATVLEVLAEALADNSAPAAPVGVEGDRALVVMSVPGIDVIPDRLPSVTAAGRPTTKAMTQTVRNAWYLAHITSHLLACVRETLAMAPGIASVTVAVVRDDDPGPTHDWVLLVSATLTRSALADVDWAQLEPAEALELMAEVEVQLRGRTRELAPLTPEPGSDLAELLAWLQRDVEDDEG